MTALSEVVRNEVAPLLSEGLDSLVAEVWERGQGSAVENCLQEKLEPLGIGLTDEQKSRLGAHAASQGIDLRRVVRAGGLTNVDLSGSDVVDLWVMVEGPMPGGSHARTEEQDVAFLRLSEVILTQDHQFIADTIGLAVFDEKTRFGLGELNGTCHAILRGLSGSPAEQIQLKDLTGVEATSTPLWHPPIPVQEGVQGTPSLPRIASAMPESLMRLPSLVEARIALSIAVLIERRGLREKLPGIRAGEEPGGKQEWDSCRSTYCNQLFDTLPDCVTQRLDKGLGVEILGDIVEGLEVLARVGQRCSFESDCWHANRRNNNNQPDGDKPTLSASIRQYLESGDLDQEQRRKTQAAYRLLSYLVDDRKVVGTVLDSDHPLSPVAVLREIGYWEDRANFQFLSSGVTTDFSEDSVTQATEISQRARDAKETIVEGRIDYRKIGRSYTVDPAEGQGDHDDGFTVEEVAGQERVTHRILLHITDVASIIGAGTPLDLEAKSRGLSVYEPRYVGMLPSELASDELSLNQGEDRRVVTLALLIDSDGRVVEEPRFSLGVANIGKNLDFEKAEALLSGRGNSSETDEVSDFSVLERFARRYREMIVAEGGLPKTSSQGAARDLIETLSHVYRCEAARFILEGGREALAWYRTPSKEGAFERYAELCSAVDPSEHERIERDALLRSGRVFGRAQWSHCPDPHPQFGSSLLPAVSPLRNYYHLLNQRILVAKLAGESSANVSPEGNRPSPESEWRIREIDASRTVQQVIAHQGDWDGVIVKVPRRQGKGTCLEVFIPDIGKVLPFQGQRSGLFHGQSVKVDVGGDPFAARNKRIFVEGQPRPHTS